MRHSVWWALFSPQAQRTIRHLGERLWLLLASSLFGLNRLPLHLLALLTQIAKVFLLVATGWRVLGSWLAAGIAATLWVLNDSLVEPLVWASAYSEILHTFGFLLAFIAFLRGIDSGNSVWLAVRLAVMVPGFGANELMVTLHSVGCRAGVAVPPRAWCPDPNFQPGRGPVYDVSPATHIESHPGSLPKN